MVGTQKTTSFVPASILIVSCDLSDDKSLGSGAINRMINPRLACVDATSEEGVGSAVRLSGPLAAAVRAYICLVFERESTEHVYV